MHTLSCVECFRCCARCNTERGPSGVVSKEFALGREEAREREREVCRERARARNKEREGRDGATYYMRIYACGEITYTHTSNIHKYS